MNKRFIALAAIVMCFVFVSAVQSSAVTLRYNENDQQWKDLAVQRVPWRSGNDPDNDYYGTNCYCFVNCVLEYEGRGSLSGFCYEAYLNGLGDRQVAQYLNANNGNRGPSESTVRAAFSQAQAGDVVQMRWSYYSGGSSVHTALVNGFDSNGVYFFQSHVSGYGVKAIKNSYYSYAELARRYTNPGTRGGFTIYRFPGGDDPWPPKIEPKPEINPGLLRLSSYAYAKSYTLTSGRYYDLYSDKNFTTPLSSGSWTGEDDDDWLLDVGWNDRNVPYARISYPVSSGRKEACVKLQDVFVNGTLNEAARTAVNGYRGLCIRKNSGQNSNYWIDPGDFVWLLTNEDGWCQVLYPILGGLYRIAWMPESEYNKLFEEDYPEPNMHITRNFADGKVGTAYSSRVYVYCETSLEISRLTMSGAGVSVISGSMPDGLNVSLTGRYVYLTGTPTKAGTYTFTLRVKNGVGGYTDKEFTVTIAPATNPPTILWTFRKGKAGISYYDYVKVKNGTLPLKSATYTGDVPTGLGISRSGRYIYLRGTPTRTGDFSFTIKVTDANGLTASKQFDITISNNSSYFRAGAGEEPDTPTKPKIATTKLDTVTVGNEFSAVLEAAGTKPIKWSIVDGELPDGVVMGETGEIVGTPAQAGNYKFKVQAANSVDVATKKYTLKVLPEKPLITTTVLPDGEKGMPYTFLLQANGEDIKFSKSGKFPKGLKLDKKIGEIYGTPTKAGTYTFKIKAKNKAGKDTAEFTVVINEESAAEDSVTSSSLPTLNAAVHEEFSHTEALYLLKDGAELEDSASVSAGMPLTFRVGEVPDEDAEESKPVISGVKIFVDDEELDGAAIAPDGTFTIPGGTVDGSFTVYASGIVDGQEFETTEIEIQAAGESENVSEIPESSGGCSVGFAGMIMLLMSGIVLLKK